MSKVDIGYGDGWLFLTGDLTAVEADEFCDWAEGFSTNDSPLILLTAWVSLQKTISELRNTIDSYVDIIETLSIENAELKEGIKPEKPVRLITVSDKTL